MLLDILGRDTMGTINFIAIYLIIYYMCYFFSHIHFRKLTLY